MGKGHVGPNVPRTGDRRRGTASSQRRQVTALGILGSSRRGGSSERVGHRPHARPSASEDQRPGSGSGGRMPADSEKRSAASGGPGDARTVSGQSPVHGEGPQVLRQRFEWVARSQRGGAAAYTFESGHHPQATAARPAADLGGAS